MAIDGGSVAPHIALANFYWSTGQLAEAEQSFNRALAIEPRNVLTNRALASFYIAAKRLPEAEQPLKAVLDVTKTRDAAFALSRSYIGMKNDEAARGILVPLLADEGSAAMANLRLASLDYPGRA